MKTLHLINRSLLATVCTALVFAHGVKAKDTPPFRFAPLTANAGITVVFVPTSDPTVSKATVTGVVQSSLLGTCVDNAELEARFPTTPDQPVVVNGTATLTSIDGASSLKLTVAGTASPDPSNPFFYNAKYQITITGGTGAYVMARGLAEITEVVMFTSSTTATATWTMKGFVLTPP